MGILRVDDEKENQPAMVSCEVKLLRLAEDGERRVDVSPCLAWSWRQMQGQGTRCEGPLSLRLCKVALRDLCCCSSLWPKSFNLLL